MQIRSRRSVALAVSALVLVGVGTGAGVALARTQKSSSPTAATQQSRSTATGRSALLEDVAKRLGIQRSKLDAALKAMALADVQWAQVNGFITKTVADMIRQRIQSGDAGDGPGLGFHGHVRFGVGFPIGGLFKGYPDEMSDVVTAAANYLGLSGNDLVDALGSKTLAQVATQQGKSVAGLEQTIRAAVKSKLDAAVKAGDLTSAQENAVLQTFDSAIGDVVNGIPPALTDLARRLEVDRTKLIAAIKGAAIDRVDAALSKDLITKTQADAIKKRIQSSPALPLGSLGSCGGGHFRPGIGRFGFDGDRAGFERQLPRRRVLNELGVASAWPPRAGDAVLLGSTIHGPPRCFRAERPFGGT